MPSLTARETAFRKERAHGLLSRMARKGQKRAVMFWFVAVCATFVGSVAAFGGARAATIASTPPQRERVIPNSIRVAVAPVRCSISPSRDPGYLSITIANSSAQVIDNSQMIFYQKNPGEEQPLHGVRAPVRIPVGGQFTAGVI